MDAVVVVTHGLSTQRDSRVTARASANLYKLLPNSLRNFYDFDDAIFIDRERSVGKDSLTPEQT